LIDFPFWQPPSKNNITNLASTEILAQLNPGKETTKFNKNELARK